MKFTYARNAHTHVRMHEHADTHTRTHAHQSVRAEQEGLLVIAHTRVAAVCFDTKGVERRVGSVEALHHHD